MKDTALPKTKLKMSLNLSIALVWIAKRLKGQGAGLTIVKGLVDAMNGNIDFTTQYGSGTTFWIDLPIKSI
jgi:signal transduction histidine kinase